MLPGESASSPGLRLMGLRGVTPSAGVYPLRVSLVLGSMLLPLGLFPGAFDRRAAGVLVSPELPPGYYPVDKSRGIEPRSRRCLTSTSEPELNRHFFASGEHKACGWAKSAILTASTQGVPSVVFKPRPPLSRCLEVSGRSEGRNHSFLNTVQPQTGHFFFRLTSPHLAQVR